MTEEVKEVIEEKIEEKQEEGLNKSEAYKAVAEDFGWDSSGEKDAKQFLLDYGKEKNNQIRKLHDTVNHLYKKFVEKDEKAYERALADINRQKQDAVYSSDVDKYKELEEEARKIMEESIKAKEENKQMESSMNMEQVQIVEDFKRRNAAWLGNKAMLSYAQGLELELQAQHPDLNPQDVLRKVEKEVAKRFPDHPAFKKEADSKVTVSDVENSGKTSQKTNVRLTPTQEAFFNSIKEAKSRVGEKFTRQDYLRMIEDKVQE